MQKLLLKTPCALLSYGFMVSTNWVVRKPVMLELIYGHTGNFMHWKYALMKNNYVCKIVEKGDFFYFYIEIENLYIFCVEKNNVAYFTLKKYQYSDTSSISKCECIHEIDRKSSVTRTHHTWRLGVCWSPDILDIL